MKLLKGHGGDLTPNPANSAICRRTKDIIAFEIFAFDFVQNLNRLGPGLASSKQDMFIGIFDESIPLKCFRRI